MKEESKHEDRFNVLSKIVGDRSIEAIGYDVPKGLKNGSAFVADADEETTRVVKEGPAGCGVCLREEEEEESVCRIKRKKNSCVESSRDDERGSFRARRRIRGSDRKLTNGVGRQ